MNTTDYMPTTKGGHSIALRHLANPAPLPLSSPINSLTASQWERMVGQIISFSYTKGWGEGGGVEAGDR